MKRMRRNMTTIDVIPTVPSPTISESFEEESGNYFMVIEYPNGQKNRIVCKDVEEVYELIDWAMKDSGIPEGTTFSFFKRQYKLERKWVRKGSAVVPVRS